MKKTAIYTLSLAVLAIAQTVTSCNSDSVATDGAGKGDDVKAKTFELTASTPTTRVGMIKDSDNKTVSFYWHPADELFVQMKKDGSYSGARFGTSADCGQTSATFTYEGTDDIELGDYALYPYGIYPNGDFSDDIYYAHNFTSATTVSFQLPKNRRYGTVDSKIFPTTNGESTEYRDHSVDIPMAGKIENGNVEFKHIGGVAVIRIDKMLTASGKVTVTANEQLSGFFDCDLSAETPVIKTTTGTENNNTVVFRFYNAEVGKPGVFYLPLATGDYTGVKIELTSISENDEYSYQTVEYRTLRIRRANITAVHLYNVDGTLQKYLKDSDGYCIVNGHKFVDLGLPSGTLWATMNIGATTTADGGNFYAWGETTPKTSFSWGNYKYGTANEQTRYNSTDNLTTLEPEDDAATVNWGADCHMPTCAQQEELDKNCDTYWETQTNSEGVSVHVIKMVSKKDESKFIYLPATGYYTEQGILGKDALGKYWSSSLYNSNLSETKYQYSYGILVSSDRTSPTDHSDRFHGHMIRPVAE